MAGDVLTLEEARRLCDLYESTLRASYREEGALPEEWQRELDARPVATAKDAVARFALLKHYYLVRQSEAETRRKRGGQEAETAARQLLRREPVRVRLARRTASVTGRSYAAMYEIAAHWARIRGIEQDLERIAGLYAQAHTAIKKAPKRKRALHRRLAHLAGLQQALYRELSLHRRALYAHALTASGAPARSLDDAPEWWDEVTPEDDARLLAACFEAGPGRYARLGPPRERKKDEEDGGESFGWGSLFASIERQQKAEPAEYYNQDLYQLMAWMRAGAPPVPDELEG